MELYICLGLPITFEELGLETDCANLVAHLTYEATEEVLPERDILHALQMANSLGEFFDAD